MLEVEPLVSQSINGIEHKMKLLDEVRKAAVKHGLNLDERSAGNIHYAGYQEIQKAQKEYALAQENGQKLLFYILLLKFDNYDGKNGIRGLVDGFCFRNEEIAKALTEAGLAKISQERGFAGYRYRDLHDNEKIHAIRSFDEGKAVYKRLQKEKQILPPYYHQWIIDEPYETPALFLSR